MEREKFVEEFTKSYIDFFERKIEEEVPEEIRKREKREMFLEAERIEEKLRRIVKIKRYFKKEMKEALELMLRFYRTKANFNFPFSLPSRLSGKSLFSLVVQAIRVGEFRGAEEEYQLTLPFYRAGVFAFLETIEGKDFGVEYLKRILILLPGKSGFSILDRLVEIVDTLSSAVILRIDREAFHDQAELNLFLEKILAPEIESIQQKLEKFSEFMKEKGPEGNGRRDFVSLLEEFKEKIERRPLSGAYL